MKTDSVWVSTIELDTSNVQTHLGFDPEEPARVALAEKRTPTTDELPLTTYAKYPDAAVGDLPEFFCGAGAYAVSGEIAEILLSFDLGTMLVLPLRVLEHDRKTEVLADRSYHLLYRYNVHQALAPEESPNLKPGRFSSPPSHWSMPWEPKGGDVAVHEAALDGPAIWRDPLLMQCHFYNGEVVKALEAAGLAHLWCFQKCRIV